MTQTENRLLVEDVVREAVLLQLSHEDLECVVYEVKRDEAFCEATRINKEGLEAQIDYLCGFYGPAEALRIVRELADVENLQ